MPVELSELLSNERWVEVHVPGGTFQVAYRPGNTSLLKQVEMQKRIRLLSSADGDEAEQVLAAATLLCETICAWDLTDQGKPLPLTSQALAGVIPGAWLESIMEAIGTDNDSAQQEKKQLSASLDAGLPKGGRSEPVPNGIPSSERHGTWA